VAERSRNIWSKQADYHSMTLCVSGASSAAGWLISTRGDSSIGTCRRTTSGLDDRHVAHLGDFDSAITTTGASDLRPITTGSFASPEELEGRSLDVRCDLFSLGGVLYVVATGARRPADLALLRSRRPDLPSAFGDLLASLLSPSPDDRPPDAESVLVQLDEVRHASNVGALVAAGESDSIEFKSSLHHPYGPLPPGMEPARARKEVQKGLRKSVTKTIAAFLNTGGGTLLIGVDDSGTMLGIEPDFPYLKQGNKTLMAGYCL
jgi:serine/threonine protein kinase